MTLALPWLASFALTLTSISLAPAKLPPGGSLGVRLDDAEPAHLGLQLRHTHEAELDALLAAQQDPASPAFHRWLTPAEFGERFGQPAETYQRAVTWLEQAGFSVRTFPNRAFLEATGTAASVRRSLGVALHRAVDVRGYAFRTFTGQLEAPDDLAPVVMAVAGIDTRPRLRRHMAFGNGVDALAPSDLRAFYDATSLFASGHGGNNLSLVVLGAAAAPGSTPDGADIDDFFQKLSLASAQYVEDPLPNPNDDYFPQNQNVAVELELDVEMQSVGAPQAATITLVEPPASEIFTTGINAVVNDFPTAASVSTSIGTCEADENVADGESVEQLIKQGNAEGQTWFAAAGDEGADDCQSGRSAAVDFPASIPEVTAMGGSEQDSPFDAQGNVTGYQQEVVWNQCSGATRGEGAGGGGASQIFHKPSWQAASTPADSARDLPDLALLAAAPPGVVAEAGGSVGQLQQIGGTSVASPLAAGFFATLAEDVGGRLGNINPALYQLGQQGARGLHDITSGNNDCDGVQGFSAAAGYDQASGWGSIDLAVLVTEWPAGAAFQGATTGTSGGGGTGSSTTTTGGSTTSVGSRGGGTSGTSGASNTDDLGSPAQPATGGTPDYDQSPQNCGTAGGLDLGAALLVGLLLRRRRQGQH